MAYISTLRINQDVPGANRVSSGIPSTVNSSAAALNTGNTFTGTAEDVSAHGSVVVGVITDQDGTLYMEFSPDGTNWDSSLSFPVSAGTNEVHRLSVTRQYYRTRFTNSSASNQTYLRLQTMLGVQPLLTSPLNGVVQADADSLLVRPTDPTLDVAAGRVTGKSVFSKFGNNQAIGTTPAPVSQSGIYQVPTSVASLEVVSSSANDTSAGTGAQQVTIIGLDANWNEISEVVTLNGMTPVPLANSYFRVYRWYVSRTGTYATQSTGSQDGTLTLRVVGAGATWSTIPLLGTLGRGQSQIGVYTVPAGKTLYIYGFDMSVDTGGTVKAASFYLFQRPNANDVSAPYTGAMRIVREYDGIAGAVRISLKYPLIFPEYTDVGFMAATSSGTTKGSVQMDGELVDN